MKQLFLLTLLTCCTQPLYTMSSNSNSSESESDSEESSSSEIPLEPHEDMIKEIEPLLDKFRQLKDILGPIAGRPVKTFEDHKNAATQEFLNNLKMEIAINPDFSSDEIQNKLNNALKTAWETREETKLKQALYYINRQPQEKNQELLLELGHFMTDEAFKHIKHLTKTIE